MNEPTIGEHPSADSAAPGNASKALSTSRPEVPRVSLRESPDGPLTPVNRPASGEIPPELRALGSSARLQLVGEIAQGGMGGHPQGPRRVPRPRPGRQGAAGKAQGQSGAGPSLPRRSADRWPATAP